MSVLPLTADINRVDQDVCYGPISDMTCPSGGCYPVNGMTEMVGGDVAMSQLAKQILGSWRMMSWTYETLETGEIKDALGPNPRGYINYAPDGRMMVLVLKQDRKTPAVLVPTPEEKIALYDTMFAYAGTYSVEADRVIHNLDMSWNKAWEGTQQVRFITTDGSTLTYRSAPAKNPLNGKDCVHTVKFQKVGDDGRHSMASGYAISLATPDDIPGILSLQEPNLPDSGGSLSVRLTEDWFKQAVAAKSVVVGRSNDRVVGYVLGTSLAAKAHVAIIQAMLRAFPPPSNCYLYGPVCVAETERGKGLASALFKELQTHMDGRPAMTFIKADNEQSLRAHDKMGMKRLGMFTNGAVTYVALKFTP